MSTSVRQPEQRTTRDDRPTAPGLIDCDVHNGLRSRADLLPYLPARWHSAYRQVPGRTPGTTPGIKPHRVFREDTWPPSGGPPGSDVGFLREQLLDRYGVGAAILSPFLDLPDWLGYGEFGTAMARAMNEWLAATWLDQDERFYGTISVPTEDPVAAAAEIERMAADRRFVHVFVAVSSQGPLGHPRYWPILEAAEAHDLPVCIHVGGMGVARTGTGDQSYFLEQHIDYPFAFQAHMVSMISEGVFTRFPRLQVILQEGGVGWMPSMLWRLDTAWEAMREDVPHLPERPSETVRRHIWLTTQPMDETENPAHLMEMLAQMDMNDRLLFASDYPHWDFDAPDRTFPSTVKADLRERYFRTNAQSLYGFRPAEEPA